MTEAYPLQWPTGWPRTPAHELPSPHLDWRVAALDGLLTMGDICLFPGYELRPIRTAPRRTALLVNADRRYEQAWRDWLGRWWQGRPPRPGQRSTRLRLGFRPTHWLRPL